MRPLLFLPVVLALAGCTSFEDIAMKTAENVARAACTAARNCSNVCPDGSTATPHTWSCPKATRP